MNLLNVEIKARCTQPKKIRSILKEKQARYIGVDRQVDTYFTVAKGRLKLREGTIENNLIYYKRPDTKKPKPSTIELIPVPKDNTSTLKRVLAEVLDIWMTVEKKREIYFIDNVKFHVDQVEQLGSFVEIEAIDKDGTRSEESLLQQCRHYLDLLGIHEDDLVEVSYSDLMADINGS